MHRVMLAGPRRRTRRALLAAALPAVLAAVALPSAAEAASVSGTQSGVAVHDRAFFRGGSIERNVVTVGAEVLSTHNLIVVTDTAGVTTTNQGSNGVCFLVSAIEARCPVARDAQVNVQLGRGNDTLRYQARHPAFVNLAEDHDTLFAGTREGNGMSLERVDYFGGPGEDTITYQYADRGISLTPEDGRDNDGRLGDHESVRGDFETFIGSSFDDAPLFGTANGDILYGNDGNDQLGGGGGSDTFVSGELDGRDDYHGGPGSDIMNYIQRTRPVLVDLDNVADDGEPGENDNVRSNVENVLGGSGDDSIKSLGAHSFLFGGDGNDHLVGGFGPDTLDGGEGVDKLEGGTENDVIFAADGSVDEDVDCGPGLDTLTRDFEGFSNCETVKVGVLRLAPRTVRANAGEPIRLRLSWQHPRAWRKLRSIELRLTRDGIPVGKITIRPRAKRIGADGGVELVRKQTRLTHDGKTVSARLAVRLDDSLGGQTLQAEVEATDTRGRRQLERAAATVRVAD
jgi:hypothetical protein